MVENSLILHIGAILEAFYDADVLEEEILLKWHKHPNKKLSKVFSAQIRKEANAFIHWLKTAEEED